MAPEQLAGRGATPRSDLYALGLILFEMFNGRPFYQAGNLEELRTQHVQPKKHRLASSPQRVEPAVERAILQCLEEDPEQRPESARVVLAGLPGGDPLEMAVAAGETPSPDMVAAAGQVGDLTPVLAWALLLAVFVCGGTAAHVLDRHSLVGETTLPRPPVVLVERARSLLVKLGHGAPVDSAWSFERDRALLAAAQKDPSPDRWEVTGYAPYLFYYRQSPQRLVAANSDAVVRRDDPPPTLSGMAEVVLDPGGRVTSFLAVPPQFEAAGGPWPEPTWGPLLESAGLDPARLRPAASLWAAPVDSDAKTAWEGTHPDDPVLPIRVEAASYHGRPVWFAVLPPWEKPGRMVGSAKMEETVPVGEIAVWVLALAMPLGGVFLARRNLRLGRVDRTGAVRVALFVFVVYSLARLFRASHVAAFGDEIWILIKILSLPAFWAMMIWLLYVALEPYARRRWPQSLVSWKRLQTGQLRDPLVGRDVLIGAAAGAASGLLFILMRQIPAWLGRAPLDPQPFLKGPTLTGFSDVAFRLFVNQFSSVLYAMVFLFMLVLLRLLLRSNLLAAAVWCLLIASPLGGEHAAILWAAGFARALLYFLVLTRGGLLALTVALYLEFNMNELPLTLDPTLWYATRSIPIVLAVAGLALYGFHTSLAGRPPFGELLAED
jgi:serine/threonine-protein kinase